MARIFWIFISLGACAAIAKTSIGQALGMLAMMGGLSVVLWPFATAFGVDWAAYVAGAVFACAALVAILLQDNSRLCRAAEGTVLLLGLTGISFWAISTIRI